jgi:hypothetical protein
MGNPVTISVGVVAGAVRTGLNAIRNQFRSLRGFLNGEIGAALSWGAIISGMNAIIEKAGKLTDISQQFGASTKFLQQVGNVAEQNGASIEGLAKALNKVSVNQEKVRAGNKEMTKALNDLGISAQSFINASPEDAFFMVSDAVAKADDKTKAYAATVQLLGRGTGELFSTLELGSEQIKKMGDAVGIMSEEQVALLDDAGDKLTDLKNRLMVWGAGLISWGVKVIQTAGAVFAGVVASISDAWEGLKKAAGNTFSFDGSFKGLKEGLDEMWDGLNGEGPQGKATWQAVKEGMDDIWKDSPAASPKSRRRNLDLEAADEEIEARKKLDEMRERLEEKRRKFAREALTDAEKLADLEKELEELKTKETIEGDEKERLKIADDILDREKDIADLKKRSEDESEKKAKEIAELRQRLEETQFARELKNIESAADKLKILQKQRELLDQQIGDAEEAGDEKKKLELQIERQKLLEQEDALAKAPKMDVIASSIARIGGGGRAFLSVQDDSGKRTAKATEKTAAETVKVKAVLDKIEDKIDKPKWQ